MLFSPPEAKLFYINYFYFEVDIFNAQYTFAH